MSDDPKLTILGKLFVLLFIGACFVGAYALWAYTRPATGGAGTSPTNPNSTNSTTPTPADPRTTPEPANANTPNVTITIAYGTEKRRWLTWAVEEFQKTPAGAKVAVKLLPMGSIEGAQAVVKGETPITVWAPASSLYEANLVTDWQMKHSGESPIVKKEVLALTPMVFVMWEERYLAFVEKYKALNFRTISQALSEKGGWNAIAAKPEWGFFKFGHTHPNQSNSGLMTLVLLAYDFHEKNNSLTLADITEPKFADWANKLQRAVTGLSNSTGKMMEEMVQRGPSTYDVLFVYEANAIDYVKNAEGRWGKLRVVYPERNAWNDNPYYILRSASKQEAAGAQVFLDYLLSEPVQTQALVHGFRPANVAVPIKSPESAFTTMESYGLRVDLPGVCEQPGPEVLNNLLIGWQRNRGN
ncbi:MAG: substrate-binding domain-containing protein [Phycisphaerales bacterium]|nr:substrate-binding domain-containing protein [Phycisphaerales bacterium]